jgi:hypothetical protein
VAGPHPSRHPGDAVNRIAPFPPSPLPLDRFLIEAGHDPEPGDYIALGGSWWLITAVEPWPPGRMVYTEGRDCCRWLGPGVEFPIARVCCRTDTRYRRPGAA